MCPDPQGISALTQDVLELAREAGLRISEIYREGYDVTLKDDATPLTTADLVAHKVITDGLRQLSYQAPVLSEESCAVPFSERTEWETYWLVDPLDGTREFIKRNGEFSVNIALIHKGSPVLGVVHAPELSVSYFAYRDGGAWKQPDDSDAEQIHVCQTQREKVVVARSRSPETGPNMRRFLEKLGDHDEVSMGGALKSCLVAEGAADVYARLGPTSEWDTGAAQCIVEEAGGHITDLKMNDLRYNTRESLINPHFFVIGSFLYDWQKFLPSGISDFPA